MGAGKEMHARTVKMSTPGVLAVVTVFYMIPGGLLSDIRDTRGLEGQLLAQGSSVLHHRQKRGWIWKQLFVQEEDPISRIIGQVKSDSDQGEFTIQYILSGEGAGDVFEMDEYSGEIRTLKKLDREEKAFYVLQAQAINRRTNEPAEPQSEFIIKVQDINDNAPQFLNEPYVSSIPEMSPVGTIVAQVTATDADDPMFGNNAKLIYSILQGEPYFSVQPKTGIIVTSWANMDREAREEYLVVVQVKDMLGLSGGYSSSTTVTISLSDVNDNGPTFQQHQYTFVLPENSAVGTTVGSIMADDGDIGINARMTYRLKDDLKESSTFIIETHPETQEGVLLLAKPLDYESKRQYAMDAEAINDHPDTRFLTLDEFSDRTKLKIFVEDVDEPPVFFSALYQWKVPENAAVGTVVGTVSARDTDAVNNPIRYSIVKKTDATNTFKIDPNNGTIAIARSLDRETSDWHNMSVEAKEITQNHLSSSVVVFITVLDVNDNMPRLARDYQPYICEGTQAGELIQLLSAVDPDEAVEEHHFYYSMVPDERINPNFTIRDNQDNTAGILARRSTFTRKDRTEYLLPVVVTDSGTPALSSTTTLTISVCSCLPAGHCPTGGVEALALSGVSMQTLIGVLVCLVMLTALSVLMLMVRRHRRKHQEGTEVEAKELELPFSQKMLHYGESEEWGAGLDFCQPVVPLRPHPRRRERRLRREEVRASIRMSLRESHLIGPEDEVFRQFILDRLAEADQDPYVPPFDCLRTYAYEGSGSPSGSLSSLDSSSLEFEPEKPVFNSKPYVVRLTPWYGGAEEDTIF
ncbi:cadherin-7 isoform X1 [Fundulus heteroclitus]|uniref:cadherin-7 isoform X1 n=2 Tax=Fundulus heteroclitus TaxID=8078 RepID=UPI00165C2A67|nr:cadherin-7 isoform X1 [Fundulus heteroclitus]XP_035985210.1 cadherin-7 isoform X1 [Fundulus heteroclitus]XP_035985211.1 cadherin-7 isoform X1 [Fundulus heteroclitus]